MTAQQDVREALQACIDDPMWADHAEVPKALLQRAVVALSQQAGEPVAWHIGNEDGSMCRLGAFYFQRKYAEDHISSYNGELKAAIVPLYAAPLSAAEIRDKALSDALDACHAIIEDPNTPVAAEGPVCLNAIRALRTSASKDAGGGANG